jgi:hypothetical protein
VTLEDAIREAARQGRLDRLSIIADPAGRGWQANAGSAYGDNAWAISINLDPVDALMGALRVEPASAEGVFG